VSENSFSPGDTMTRGMFVTVLGRVAKVDANLYKEFSFGDVKEGDWFAAYAEWAYRNQVTSGVGENNFGPGEAVTREQIATIAYNYARTLNADLKSARESLPFADSGEASDWAETALLWMVDKGILQGKNDNRLDPKGLATRAEVAAITMRLIAALNLE
jgi:hypothetical protein